MGTSRRAVVVAVSVSLVAALTACAGPAPQTAESSSTASSAASAPPPSPVATASSPSPSPTPTPTTPQLYVTSEGIGELRMGKPVPPGAALVKWDATACGAPGSGAWLAPKITDTNNRDRAFDTLVDGGVKNGKIVGFVVWSPSVATKSGIRVGDSRAKLEATFPKFDATISDKKGLTDLYALKGTAGTVIFEVIPERQKDYWGTDYGKPETIVWIRVVPADHKVDSIAGGDTGGSCTG